MKKRQSAQDLEVLVDPLFDDSPRGSPTHRDLDPLFDDVPSPSKKEDDDESLFFSSSPAPATTANYTFTWRGWYSHLFYENKYSTYALLLVSFLLFVGYFLSRDSPVHPAMPFFTLFVLHYTIAFLVGLCLVIAYFIKRQKPAPESSILLACVLWSHYPDVLGMMSSIPHQPWMIIFFMHTSVEASSEHLWLVVLAIDLVLAYYYHSLIEESRPKTSTRSLVAML